MYGAFKKFILLAVGVVFLSPLVDYLTGFGQVSALNMIQHLFFSYRAIEKNGLKENAVNIMGPYNPAEPIARLIEQLKRRDN